jgi:putative transposase
VRFRRHNCFCNTTNITRHPTAGWVVQQLREAFPEAGPYRYAILDHDSKFDADVIAFLKATGLRPKRTSVQAPWQNGVAERWVGSCRREILDYVIALNEQHLRRLIRDYVNYHHDDRIHDSLDKDTPNRRPVESKPSPAATAFIIDIAGAKLRNDLASADSMLFVALRRLSAVDPAQSASGSHGRRDPLALSSRTAAQCSGAQRSSGSNEVLATHRWRVRAHAEERGA